MTAGSTPDLVHVLVHPQLMAGERGFVIPAVRQHPKSLVHQTLAVQRLERPEHRLHVVGFEGLVVMIEIHPPGLPGDVFLPLGRVAQHRLATCLVECRDPQIFDIGLGLQAQLCHRLQLGGQPVAVPAEPTLDAATPHGLVARHDVLDVAGEQVAVVGQTVGERRPVVEHELIGAVDAGWIPLHRSVEGVVGLPVRQNVLLQPRKARAGRHAGLLGVCRGRAAGFGVDRHGARLRLADLLLHEDDVTTAVPPRLPSAVTMITGSTAHSEAVTGPPVRFY